MSPANRSLSPVKTGKNGQNGKRNTPNVKKYTVGGSCYPSEKNTKQVFDPQESHKPEACAYENDLKKKKLEVFGTTDLSLQVGVFLEFTVTHRHIDTSMYHVTLIAAKMPGPLFVEDDLAKGMNKANISKSKQPKIDNLLPICEIATRVTKRTSS